MKYWHTNFLAHLSMKRLLVMLVVLAGAYLNYAQRTADNTPTRSDNSNQRPESGASNSSASAVQDAAERAFAAQQSNVQLQIQGTVSKLLRDDNDGSRHQRFVVTLPSGHTVLVAHNIDLSERIANLQAGDHITLYGEYEWNAQGGVLHWTHRDPGSTHPAGWIKHDNRTYQ
jgi:membrane protein implicated in regulation of membrane protease activity